MPAKANQRIQRGAAGSAGCTGHGKVRTQWIIQQFRFPVIQRKMRLALNRIPKHPHSSLAARIRQPPVKRSQCPASAQGEFQIGRIIAG